RSPTARVGERCQADGHTVEPRETGIAVPATHATVGAAWGPIYDTNGDGLADLVVGRACLHLLQWTPSVDIYLGGTTGLAPGPTVLTGTAIFGADVANAGDLDGDGFADVAVMSVAPVPTGPTYVEIFPGGPAGVAPTASRRLDGAFDTAGGVFGYHGLVGIGD